MHAFVHTLCALGIAASALAVDVTWTGNVSTDWNNRQNWQITGTSTVPLAVPDLTSVVTIPAGKTVGVTDPGDFGNEVDIFAKALVCAGTINLNQGTGIAVLNVAGDLTLNGGVINLGSASVTASTGLSGFLTLASPTATISGPGQINIGTEDASRPSRLQLATGGVCTIGSGVTINGGRWTIERIDLNNSASTSLVISNGATISVAANGWLFFDSIDCLNQGTLRFANTAYMSLPMSNYVQSASGIFDVTIGANYHPFIDSAGTSTSLDGTLIVTVASNYSPAAGSTFNISNVAPKQTDPLIGPNFSTFINTSGQITAPVWNSSTNELQVTYSFQTQSVTFPTLSNGIIVGGSSVPLTATTTATGLPITYTISLVANADGTTTLPLSASLVGNTLVPGSLAETVRITASAAAGKINGVNYATDSVTQDVIVHQIPSITIQNSPANTLVGDSFNLTTNRSITTWLGTLLVPTWSSSNSAVATITSVGQVAIVGQGTATLTVVTQAIPPYLLAGNSTLNITVAAKSQSVTITAPSSPVSVVLATPAGTATYSATYKTTKSVSWTSSNPAVATVTKLADAAGVSTAKVTYVGVGTTTIAFNALADATYALGTASVTVTVSSTDQKTNFVTRFYQEILNRTPDAGGLTTWTTALADGSKAGADLAYGFILSAEFTNRNLTNSDFVATMYRAFFGRAYDQGGYDVWMGQLAQGVPREDVLYGFIFAQEFANLANTYSINQASPDIIRRKTVRAFASRFYTVVLGRQAETGGLANWTDSLLSGAITGEALAQGFVFSAEFTNKNVSNDIFVTTLYKSFFNRDPDAGGYAAWMNALAGGTTRAQVLSGFTRAQEFINLCNASNILAFPVGG